ncbi:tRNA (N6-threonylcarbamoyladenosine(37)-N6)-methyltransferase TrmO [Cocleimonas sp. KMM 6892]|uniref:tRNA (N6-threonylcarbamoyladenosine(37)-N6)-methyltransferase TrmO n=1 Tax=unclassified Cocleimonas TaxID=2639732 RepID=UPI002DC05B16|nr:MULTISPECIES: tRNA (N6-threonylcarbamoyladenosine(37)-N6)-methyltransferase TrmO [unclassified Cocleimonas]MEB8432539.1 tRNA (N6-threonylcarbamoyladenosine(37)-N6)-methyltransferase TrmO [Cocleimonas sp. KMM 6892]MEC4715398.1 tRNA (N6-threonylcarbamoyladenosine(37)-N6)-methyltransferase TrmO [Cocleimonas sp. KMM 6895]MEC4744983.1 tRNA (N6-threonylcarbamoyladenosine(37)-N6)-methyltransferase TrmO [Cocleimonas sp. KMM 6896]
MKSLNFTPIGLISSCFKEKFGIPRQPGLVTAAKAQLKLDKIFTEESVRELEGFSHIWLQFIFHQTESQGWKPMIRPPRLGGNKKVGVFASRSTFRPNPIGLSVVELEGIEMKSSGVVLHLKGCDLVDGTPILDIKPYLPYVDAIPEAEAGYAKEKPSSYMTVLMSDEIIQACHDASHRLGEDVEVLVRQLLELDPRPSYHENNTNDQRIYSMKLLDFDLRWQYCENNTIKVLSID